MYNKRWFSDYCNYFRYGRKTISWDTVAFCVFQTTVRVMTITKKSLLSKRGKKKGINIISDQGGGLKLFAEKDSVMLSFLAVYIIYKNDII